MENNLHIRGGAVLTARKTFESDLWLNKPSSWYKIWTFILGNVQHDDFNQLKRGEGFFNFRELIRTKSLGADVTYGQTDKFLRYARQSKMLSTRKATHGMIVLVCNYGLYQELKNYKVERSVETVVEVPVETESKQGRNEVDNINKNDKNVKNDVENTRDTTNSTIASEEKNENVESVKVPASAYPTFASLTPDVLETIATQKRVKLTDVQGLYEEMDTYISSNAKGAKKAKDIINFKKWLESWVQRGIKRGDIKPKLTVREAMEADGVTVY